MANATSRASPQATSSHDPHQAAFAANSTSSTPNPQKPARNRGRGAPNTRNRGAATKNRA